MQHFLTSSYTPEGFQDFLYKTLKAQKIENLSPQDYKKSESPILSYTQIALPKTLDQDNDKKICFYAFNVKSIKAKMALHTEIKKIFLHTSFDAILAVFYEDSNPTQFRLSLITFGFDPQKAKRTVSNLKRQSFTLGKNEKTNTAEQNFQKLFTNWQSSPTQATLSEAFSVEPVTKAFFESYKALYDEKLIFLSKNQAIVNIFAEAYPQEDPQKAISTFIKKLLGRIVFLYFIQKKGWLGVPKDSKWGEGDRKFLKNLYDKHNSGFYEKALAPLFFESLNKDRRDDGDYSPIFDCRIPFLNGGLFEENGIDRDKMLCELLDKEFFADIFELFELYNFTIDESTPSEIEVGIDPEMLGKVFENLIDYNKELGAFYTRRGIVHFMCKNSLVLKLTQVFGDENKEHIEKLIYNQESNDFVEKNADKILSTLKSLKILDPAIGSGAFPMGLLSEILSIHTTLDKTLDDSSLAKSKRAIIENNIYGIDIDSDAIEIAKLRFWLSIAVDEEEPRPLPNLDFKFMQGNSLLETLDGFELLPKDLLVTHSAPIDSLFSKKELGLQEDLLDYGNRQNSSFISIKDNIHAFFKTTEPQEKQNIKESIRNEIAKILEDQIENGEKNLNKIEKEIAEIRANGGKESKRIKNLEKQYDKLFTQLNNAYKFQESFINGGFRTDLLFLYKLFFGEVFQEGGFDIVIGNPPYIRQEDIFLKDQIKSEFGNFFSGTADIFTYFFAKGLQVLKTKGILSFITSNKWARAGYGTPLRKLILSNTFSSYIDFNGVKAFENATVDTSITTLIKSPSSEDWSFPTFALQQSQNPQAVLDNEKMIFSLLSHGSISMPKSYLQEDCFVFGDTQLLSLKKKIESLGTPLKDWDITINYGIKTGCNEAFIINSEKREEILKNCKTQEEREATEQIIKKILRGKDIKHYSYEWTNLWIIAIEFGAHQYLQEKYPSIYSHLLQYQDRLKARGQCTNKPITDKKPYLGQHHWLELDNNPTRGYFSNLEKEKIIYSEIVSEPQFFLDQGLFYAEATTFVMYGNKLRYILGLLNSLVVAKIFKKLYAGGGLGEEGYRYKKKFLERLPIPQITESNQSIADKIIALVEEILKAKEQNTKANTSAQEDKIDELVYQLYNLTPEEIKIIEGK